MAEISWPAPAAQPNFTLQVTLGKIAFGRVMGTEGVIVSLAGCYGVNARRVEKRA
jgi:hypothetical protein